MTVKYNCRVCGLKQLEPPWGEDGLTPTFEICPCCGVEFGYEDNNVLSTRKFRKEWVANGKKWFSLNEKPPDWQFKEQIEQIPEEFL